MKKVRHFQESITFKLDTDLKRKFVEFCEVKNINHSALMRRFILLYLYWSKDEKISKDVFEVLDNRAIFERFQKLLESEKI